MRVNPITPSVKPVDRKTHGQPIPGIDLRLASIHAQSMETEPMFTLKVNGRIVDTVA